MRVMGFSVWTLIIILVAFVIGAKNPSLLSKVPGLNRL